MTNERSILAQKLRPLVLKTMEQESGYEQALAFLRYEAVRKLSPKVFSDLFAHNIEHGTPFDQLLDELILDSIKN